jgi:hypothetical protein
MISILLARRKFQSILQRLNKGRLIRPDSCSRKTAPSGALEHNQSYQTPRRLFIFLIATVLPSLLRRIMPTAFTRLRLVSDGRRLEMLVLRRGVSGDAQVKPSFRVSSSV